MVRRGTAMALLWNRDRGARREAMRTVVPVTTDDLNSIGNGLSMLPAGKKPVAGNLHAPDNAARSGAVPGR